MVKTQLKRATGEKMDSSGYKTGINSETFKTDDWRKKRHWACF